MFGRTFARETGVRTGFDDAKIAEVTLLVPDATKAASMGAELARRIASIPGVARVTQTDYAFIWWEKLRGPAGTITTSATRGTRSALIHDIQPEGIDDGFFETFGIPIRAGRSLTADEVRQQRPWPWSASASPGRSGRMSRR